MPRRGNAKLTEQEVRAIRTEYATGKVLQKVLAWKYNVTRPAISMVVTRRNWRWVR